MPRSLRLLLFLVGNRCVVIGQLIIDALLVEILCFLRVRNAATLLRDKAKTILYTVDFAIR